MSFNLEQLAMEDSSELHLTHPVSGEKLYADEAKKKPLIVTVYGPSSKQYRNCMTALQNRALKRGNKKPTAEQLREEGTELLVACSGKISNLVINGAPVDNAEAFLSLYENPQFLWLRDQVDAHIADTGAFLKA